MGGAGGHHPQLPAGVCEVAFVREGAEGAAGSWAPPASSRQHAGSARRAARAPTSHAAPPRRAGRGGVPRERRAAGAAGAAHSARGGAVWGLPWHHLPLPVHRHGHVSSLISVLPSHSWFQPMGWQMGWLTGWLLTAGLPRGTRALPGTPAPPSLPPLPHLQVLHRAPLPLPPRVADNHGGGLLPVPGARRAVALKLPPRARACGDGARLSGGCQAAAARTRPAGAQAAAALA